jgi:DNA-binding XRE family transcriptional regulator
MLCQGLLLTFYKLFVNLIIRLQTKEEYSLERKLQIAGRIKQARLDSGLSQKELGKLYGSSDVTIGEIERGISNVTIPDLERLGGILGKPLSYFLSGINTEYKRPIETS